MRNKKLKGLNEKMRKLSCDVLIIGGGAAGLRAAIEAHDSGTDVLIVSKSRKDDPHTVLATGGINGALATMDPNDNWMIHSVDTLKEGCLIADYEKVMTLCKNTNRQVSNLFVYSHCYPSIKYSKYVPNLLYATKLTSRYMSQQQDLAKELSQRVGISQEQAGNVIRIVSKSLLQKAEPNKASSLMSKLPSGITSLFSDNEKQGFTTQQQNISNEDVVRQVRTEAGINDDKKAQQATEESVKLLQEKTGEEGLLDNVMGGFKKMFG
jgi:uncharacterized protein (DUF2267 family)